MKRILFSTSLLATGLLILIAVACSGNRESKGTKENDTTAVLRYRGDQYTTDKGGGSFVITGKGIEEMVNAVTEKHDRDNERLWGIIGTLIVVIWGGLMFYIRMLNKNTVSVGSKVETISLEINTLSTKVSQLHQWRIDYEKLCNERHQRDERHK